MIDDVPHRLLIIDDDKAMRSVLARQVEQRDYPASRNCDRIQGFYYARPEPAHIYAERLYKD